MTYPSEDTYDTESTWFKQNPWLNPGCNSSTVHEKAEKEVIKKLSKLTDKQLHERVMLHDVRQKIEFILDNTTWNTNFSNPDDSVAFMELKGKLINSVEKIDDIDKRIVNGVRYSGDYPK